MTKKDIQREGKIRVFICYSDEDKIFVNKLANIIEEVGLYPLWDKELTKGAGADGKGFDEQIKIFIQHAHVFVPVLSEARSQWLHQEIGYAKALHIPVVPITTEDIDPGGMLQMINALKISIETDKMRDEIDAELFEAPIQKESPIAMYKRAPFVEDRAKMMSDYANSVISMKKIGLVRQRGGLSSFHIPKEIADIDSWNNRYFPENKSRKHKQLQQKERELLERHVDLAGCRLIIEPSYAIKKRHPKAARTRLNTFIEFLESRTDEEVVVAIRDAESKIESLTIVGDWFLAESVSFKRRDGFTNTFFTRNATEISERINEFEGQLKYLLRKWNWSEKDSRLNTIQELKRRLAEIKD